MTIDEKFMKKINFPIVLSRLSVLKPIPEVSVICILCCKFKNLTTMYAVNKVGSCLFLVSICTTNFGASKHKILLHNNENVCL